MSVPSNTETARLKLWTATMGAVGLGLLLTGAGGQLRDEVVARLLKRALFNQESQNRLPWEEPTPGRAAGTVARLAMESVPLLGVIGNLVLPANSPARASYEPTLAVLEAAKAVAEYTKNVGTTGDPTFGLPELAQKFVPDSKVVLNRLDSQEGRRLANNAVADIKRYASPDLVRPAYKGAPGSGASPLAPYVQQMENAAQRRDNVGFNQAYQSAIAAARQMGKADPERTVQNAFRSRDPEVRALNRRMTDSERAEMLRRASDGMGPNLANEIREAQRNYDWAASMIGIGQGRAGSTGSARTNTTRVSTRTPSLRKPPSSFYAPGRRVSRY